MRAVNLRLIGSGQGSVEPRAYRAELQALADAILSGVFDVPVRRVRLSEVESAWSASGGGRIVIVP
ncbi:MAG: hypothetical protein LBC97_09950 [Bifidobacteriaceae bacterium]|nr:hypothetical protein [Bifidobacteriaceae bacterium]